MWEKKDGEVFFRSLPIRFARSRIVPSVLNFFAPRMKNKRMIDVWSRPSFGFLICNFKWMMGQILKCEYYLLNAKFKAPNLLWRWTGVSMTALVFWRFNICFANICKSRSPYLTIFGVNMLVALPACVKANDQLRHKTRTENTDNFTTHTKHYFPMATIWTKLWNWYISRISMRATTRNRMTKKNNLQIEIANTNKIVLFFFSLCFSLFVYAWRMWTWIAICLALRKCVDFT